VTEPEQPAFPVPTVERAVSLPFWVIRAAILLFLVHAFNYLYFFVDDEAIPFVYAQNLLNGHGLSYNALEGRLEGYSDFLHLLWSTVILAIVRAARIPKDSVFFVGKATSIFCGIGILWLVWLVLRRSRIREAAACAALGTLALAAPFALWSCSSLEAIPFALMTTALIAALVFERDRWAAILSALLVLERIDGFVYASALIAAFAVTAASTRRREMIRRIVMPFGLVFVAYHGWRWWYFKDLVPAPVEAKVLYKLFPHQHVVLKRPYRSYALQLIDAYGWPAVLAVVAATAHGWTTGGWSRRLALAALPLAVYVSMVGDWMFGFRFFIPLLPIFALLTANVVDRIAALRPRLAVGLCTLALAYSSIVAVRFSSTYVRVEETPSFLKSPSRDPHRFFWPYYGLYETARQVIFPGDVIADNQAGFLPFMLDVNNIDDLGICSRFPADVPSTDIYFTEVGRYAPLTYKDVLRPAHAYFLYRNVQFVVTRSDILARANHNQVPAAVLGRRYELFRLDAEHQNAIYKRSPARTDPITPQLFTDNVAHVSYLRAAQIGEATIDPKDYLSALPFLRDETGSIPFSSHTQLLVEFSDVDQRVDDVTIDNLHTSTHPVDVRIQMLTSAGTVAGQADIALTADRSAAQVSFNVPAGKANRLLMTIDAHGKDGQLWIDDLRVRGQRRELGEYVRRHLDFSQPQLPQY
jgi:hypothetical protein